MIDIVVVGSGFGGAVMAARLGAAARMIGSGASVLVLEQGPDPTGLFDTRSAGGALNGQGNRFRHTFSLDYLSNFAQIYLDTMSSYRPGVPSMGTPRRAGCGGCGRWASKPGCSSSCARAGALGRWQAPRFNPG